MKYPVKVPVVTAGINSNSSECRRKVPVPRNPAESSPVLLPSGHALLIDGPLQLPVAGEDALVVDDDGFDDLIDVGLAGHRILPVRNVHQRGPEADGQVVGIHHVLIAVLGQAAGTRVREGGREGRSCPAPAQAPLSPSCPLPMGHCHHASAGLGNNQGTTPHGSTHAAKMGKPWQKGQQGGTWGSRKTDSLVKESKEVSHDHDDSPRQSDNDLLDLVHSLCRVLNFWNTRIESTSLKTFSGPDSSALEGLVPDLVVQ